MGTWASRVIKGLMGSLPGIPGHVIDLRRDIVPLIICVWSGTPVLGYPNFWALCYNP